MASEFKSDDFWPLFGKKKLSKMGKIPDLTNFRQFLAEKGVTCYPIGIPRPDLESYHYFG